MDTSRSVRRMAYYLRSIGTLLGGVRNWPVLLRLLRKGRGPVALTLRDGTRYRVDSLMGAWIVKETNLDRDYERHGTPIEDGWNVVDIGAGLGDFTIFAARRTPHGRVYAYEPAPDSIDLLRQNLALNQAQNVTLFPHAVGSSRATLNLDISGGVAVQYRTVQAPGGQASAQGKVAVRCVTLSDVLADLPGGVCDFLKMDCEGAEYDILLNADAATLDQIRRICLEYHDYAAHEPAAYEPAAVGSAASEPAAAQPRSHADLVRFFEQRGWRVRLYPSAVHRELGFLYAERI